MKEIVVIDGENYTKIKLPSFTKFKGTKGVSPYEKFHNWIGEQFGKKESDKINVSANWVTSEDDSKLRDLTLQWMIKSHKLSERIAKKNIPWISLEVGPAILSQDDIDSGFVYVVEEELFKAK
jgi:hypothetical protein